MRVYYRKFSQNKVALYIDLHEYLKDYCVIFSRVIGNKRPSLRRAWEGFILGTEIVYKSDWKLVREPEKIEFVRSKFPYFEDPDLL